MEGSNQWTCLKGLSDYTSSWQIYLIETHWKMGYIFCSVACSIMHAAWHISVPWHMVKLQESQNRATLCLITPESTLAQSQGISQVMASVWHCCFHLCLEGDKKMNQLASFVAQVSKLFWLLCSFEKISSHLKVTKHKP